MTKACPPRYNERVNKESGSDYQSKTALSPKKDKFIMTQINETLPQAIEKQLIAAVAILESINEVYGKSLNFNHACDLQMAMQRVKVVLGEPSPQYVEYSAAARQEVIKKAEQMIEETDQLLGAA